MANCNEIFREFNKAIMLSQSRKDSLKTSRKGLKDRIVNYFKENKKDEIQPKFSSQGSFDTNTIINPIPRKEKDENGNEVTKLYYDLDYGIYFLGDENAEDRKTPATYHKWIVDAVDGHTSTPPIDKNTCIRVIFYDGHHIDLPIYYKKEGEKPELAHKSKSWIFSDPKEFKDWLMGHINKNEQLRRIIRYMKAWKDFREYSNSNKKFPSGLILSILAAESYISNERDDIALRDTLQVIKYKLNSKFECLRPTTPNNEDLLKDYNHEDYFKSNLNDLITAGTNAIEEKNQKKACEYWQKYFGDRLPCNLAKDEKEENNNLAATLGLTTGFIPKPFCDERYF